MPHARLERLVARKYIVDNAVAFLSEVAQKEWMARLPMKQANLSPSSDVEEIKVPPYVNPDNYHTPHSDYLTEQFIQTNNVIDINQARLIANQEAVGLDEENEDVFDYPGYSEEKPNILKFPIPDVDIDEALRDLGYRKSA